jgi:hypothetical protein
MKYIISIILILIVLTGCTTIQASVLRKQIDACHKNGLETLVYKDQYGATFSVVCTVGDNEADNVIRINVLSEIVDILK